MQEITKTNRPNNSLKICNLSIEDKQRLVGAFVWLIEEDKKQNPLNYKKPKTQNND